MSMDTIVGTLTRADGLERVLVVKRADDLTTYRRQGLDLASGQWSVPGPDCGLYGSIETAEAEARAKVWWLAT
jgi:hypothetical protein